MAQKMTWEEMKKAYPDEWLLITLPALGKSCAFKFTGECQFPGGLRAHATHHHL